MRSKDKRMLARIVVSSILLAAAYILTEKTSLLPDSTPLRLAIYFLPYATVGYDILWRAIRNIFRGNILDENFLMSVATIGAIAIGDYPEGVFVMLFYQVGELFQDIAMAKSRRSIKSLAKIRADTAWIESEGQLKEISCESICIDDIIIVRPGDRVPLDGIITEGNTTLDTSALTGESLPKYAEAGDKIISGCVNNGGLIKVRVTSLFYESTVSRILHMVEESAANKSKSEAFISKFARVYTPIVVALAAILAILPPVFLGAGEWDIWKEWILRAMTFLVISCPCALVISVPLTFFGGVGCASQNGILVKGTNYLEILSKCDTVVFDKTGTLTKGKFEVSEIYPVTGQDKKQLLFIAACAESYSNHPIAAALKDSCPGADISMASNIEEIAGRGVSAFINSKKTLVGNLLLMQENNIDVSYIPEYGTTVYVAQENEYIGCISITDVIKDNAKTAIEKLKVAGVRRCIMLTGDRQSEAENIARQAGIDLYYAGLMPQDKVKKVEELLNSPETNKLAFVGDGINDAPVLARSDIGIAMGALGSDAAIEACDVVLMQDNLELISKAIDISKKTLRIVMQNIIFSISVKVMVMILGACGLAPLGFAVFADVGVAVIAILNAMRMLKSQVIAN